MTYLVNFLIKGEKFSIDIVFQQELFNFIRKYFFCKGMLVDKCRINVRIIKVFIL